MRFIASIVILSICVATSLCSQTYTYIPGAQLGAPDGFWGRIQENGDSTWMLTKANRNSEGPDALILHDRWTTTAVLNTPRIPYTNYFVDGAVFAPTAAWLGFQNQIAFTTDYATWKEITINPPGREVQPYTLSPYDGVGVLASMYSYVVTKADTQNGVVMKWSDAHGRSVELLTPTDRLLLYRDSVHGSSPLTNVVQISTNKFVVASGFGLIFLTINGTDVYRQSVDFPLGYYRGAQMHLHRTSGNVFYVFFGPSDSPTGSIGPSMMVYQEASNTFEQVDLSDIGIINHATSRGDLVIGSTGDGIALIKGSRTHFFPLSDGVTPYGLEIRGSSFVNDDTLIALSPNGLFIISTAAFAATSVEAPSPGRTLTTSSSKLVGIVDGTQEVVWTVFDNTGRLMLAGMLGIGESDLHIPLEGVSSGVYHLRLSANARILRTQSLLVTR